MADEKKVKFVLDLDVKDFTEAGLKAQGVISKLGNAEGMGELLEHLTSASLALGTLGAAAYAFKKAIDLSEEAEHLKQVDNQFKEITASAGISGIALKEGLEESSKGLIDTNHLLEIANKAIIKMGSSAEKLPEIMELARKSTLVFGGDLAQNFEAMTTALSNGNVRMLKAQGINIDATKAVQEFAKANGIAANEVSEAGKRQAILNAALEQGEERFKNVTGDLNKTTSILQVIKVSFIEIGEIFTLVFDKTIGPTLKAFLINFRDAMITMKQYTQATFGEGLDQSNAQIALTEKKIQSLHETIERLENQKKTGVFTTGDEAALDQVNQQLLTTQAQLDKIKEKNAEIHAEEKKNEDEKIAANGGGRTDEDIVNQEAKKKNEEKYQQELFDIRKKYVDAESENVQSNEAIEETIRQQNLLYEEEYQKQIEQIKNDSNLNDQQRMELIDQQHELHQEQMMQREKSNDRERNRMLDNYTKNSTNAANGIGRAFSAQSQKSGRELRDFGKMGTQVMQSFERHSTFAFEKMGAEMAKGKNIAQASADAMKSIFLNMIADRAIASGSMMLLEGVGSLNPVEAAAGAGLIALGGAIRSMAGGSSNGAIPEGGMGGGLGSPDGVSMPVTSTDGVDQSKNTMAQKTVNVNIAGNLMNTAESQRAIMEAIRQETDATDFNYNRIGV